MKPFTLPRWRFTSCCGHYWGHTPAAPEAVSGHPDRRAFIKAAASGVAGLAALATLRRPADAQVRVFPPPPPAVSPIEGLIDFHNQAGALHRSRLPD